MGLEYCQHYFDDTRLISYLPQIWILLCQLRSQSDKQHCSSRALDHTLS